MRAAAGYVWGDSPLHRTPASAKLAALLALSLAVALSEGPALAADLLVLLVLVALSRVGWRRALAPVWGMRWFLLLVVAMNALLLSREGALLELGPLSLTPRGLAQGLTVAARVALVAALGALLTATTRPQELVEGVRRLLSPLARLGVPVEPAALAVGVTVQFVPTLLRESRQLIWAQRLRCGDVASRGIMRRAVSYVRLLVPIFVSAFRRADELSAAMEARGYRLSDTPAGPRTREGRRP